VVRSFAFMEWMDSSVWLFSGSFVCIGGMDGFFGVVVQWFVRLPSWSGWILRCGCSVVRSFAFVEWMDSSVWLFSGSLVCLGGVDGFFGVIVRWFVRLRWWNGWILRSCCS
jgi:hypothetical protein